MLRDAALRTLRLSRGADDAAVRAAYLRLAKEYHPDVSTEHTGGEAFKRISEAAEFLLGEGSAAARDTRAAETVGPAIRARWNIRRRHQPSEYPAWFKPSTPEPNSRGLHTFALFHPAAAMQQQLLSTPPHPSPPSPPPPPHLPPPPDLQAIQFKLWDARASFTSLVPRVLLSALQWRLLRGVLVGGTRHARGTVRSQETSECERTSPPR